VIGSQAYLSVARFGKPFAEGVERVEGTEVHLVGCWRCVGGMPPGLANVLIGAIVGAKAPSDGNSPVVAYC
jgi:hypothetical protein